MSRVRNACVGRQRPLRALVVTAALIGMAAPAVAQTRIQTAAVTEPGKGLTLENAVPLPVPPPPKISRQQTVKAPQPFAAPRPIEPPPLPTVDARDAVPPPAPVTGAPPAQANTRPAPAPAAPPPPAVAEVKPAPAPAQAPTQTAALPPPVPTPVAPAPALSVVFPAESTDLPESADATINQLAERMRASETARLQLRSYASGTPETAREARQLSLARALALRERLTAFGIRSTRIDIRALGTGSTDGPPDRIDVEFTN